MHDLKRFLRYWLVFSRGKYPPKENKSYPKTLRSRTSYYSKYPLWIK